MDPMTPRLLRAVPDTESAEQTRWYAEAQAIVMKVRSKLDDESRPAEVRAAYGEVLAALVEYSEAHDRLDEANTRYVELCRRHGIELEAFDDDDDFEFGPGEPEPPRAERDERVVGDVTVGAAEGSGRRYGVSVRVERADGVGRGRVHVYVGRDPQPELDFSSVVGLDNWTCRIIAASVITGHTDRMHLRLDRTSTEELRRLLTDAEGLLDR